MHIVESSQKQSKDPLSFHSLLLFFLPLYLLFLFLSASNFVCSISFTFFFGFFCLFSRFLALLLSSISSLFLLSLSFSFPIPSQIPLKHHLSIIISSISKLTFITFRALMTQALSHEKLRPGSWPEAAVARTQFHLSQILTQQRKDPDEANRLAVQAREVMNKLLPLHPLDGAMETKEGGGMELALFDHLQPVYDGRFTGRDLLGYFLNRES
jgi:hypothetical protein